MKRAEDGKPGYANNVCIFVAYQKKLDLSTRLYLRFLHSIGFAIFFVNNAKTHQLDISELAEFVNRIYDRINLGQDFGAVKDVFLTLRQEGILAKARYLLIANDSMQFIPGAFSKTLKESILEEMDNERAAIFTHVNFEQHTHYQSFFQVISADIFNGYDYVKFWQSYVPLSHRGHTIDKGEVLLTKQIYSKHANISILYSVANYAQKALGLQESVQNQTNLEELSPVLMQDPSFFLPSPASTITRYTNAWYYADFFAFEKRWDALNSQRAPQSKRVNGISRIKKMAFHAKIYSAPELFQLLEGSNQSHTGAWIYPLILSCPIVKKDICFAGTFTIAAVIANYKHILALSIANPSPVEKEIMQNLCDEFEKLLIRKGTPASFRKSMAKAAKLGLTQGFAYPFDPTSLY
jgi:hypothetical protein